MLNAYYFRHHMYSLVPRHVREDMEWMADVGTDAVSIAVLEQDLFASQYNINIICREAERVGMAVYAVPSRWGGLIAGAPKVPSRFTVECPEAAALDENGQPYFMISGIVASVHHPGTLEFFRKSLETLLTEYPIRGIIWDEIKNTGLCDYSQAARNALGDKVSDLETNIDATVVFFGKLNRYIKEINSQVSTSLFLYAHCQGYGVPAFAQTEALDYYGCDGRPWSVEDGGSAEDRDAQKCLLTHAPRFFKEAEKHGKSGLILIENHNMQCQDFDLLDKRLDDTLNLNAAHVLYYYYPRNVDDPDRQMEIMAKHLKPRFSRSRQ